MRRTRVLQGGPAPACVRLRCLANRSQHRVVVLQITKPRNQIFLFSQLRKRLGFEGKILQDAIGGRHHLIVIKFVLVKIFHEVSLNRTILAFVQPNNVVYLRIPSYSVLLLHYMNFS